MASFNANMAKEFSNQQTYKYGDYCMNDKTLYRHTNPEDTKGPFDEKDWTVTNLFPLVQGKYELDNTNNLAPAYESGRSYSKDDVVDKNGLLYICTVDSSNDTWDETEWGLTNLTELTGLNANLGGKGAEIFTLKQCLNSSSNGSFTVTEKGYYVLLTTGYSTMTHSAPNSEIISAGYATFEYNGLNPRVDVSGIKANVGDVISFSGGYSGHQMVLLYYVNCDSNKYDMIIAGKCTSSNPTYALKAGFYVMPYSGYTSNTSFTRWVYHTSDSLYYYDWNGENKFASAEAFAIPEDMKVTISNSATHWVNAVIGFIKK